MDGIEKLKGVTIIAATNRPDCIDPVCQDDIVNNGIHKSTFLHIF